MNRKQITAILGGILLISILNYLLIYFEQQVEGSDLTNFENVMWYMIVTLTTVGYGDLYPISTGGKIIGYVYVFSSLGVLGYLFSTVSNKIYTMLEERKLGFEGTKFENHIVFLGWNEFSQMVADEVVDANRKIAIITNQKDHVDLIYDQYDKKNVFVLFSDRHTDETYERLNLNKSTVVFIALDDDAESLMEVINLKKEYPDLDLVVSLQKSKLKNTFRAAGVTHVIARNEIASKLVASYIFEPDVADLNIELISSAGAENEFDVLEFEVLEGNPYLGKNSHEIFYALKEDHDTVLMGFSKLIGEERKLIANPGKDIILEKGDYLVVMTTGLGKQKLTEVFGTEQGRMHTTAK
jgi:voltage-gated potassium channel